MDYRTTQHSECRACGERYAAEVDYRPEDDPPVQRSDVWLDGRLYCPACLDVLESR
jgi:hypothetical protein